MQSAAVVKMLALWLEVVWAKRMGARPPLVTLQFTSSIHCCSSVADRRC